MVQRILKTEIWDRDNSEGETEEIPIDPSALLWGKNRFKTQPAIVALQNKNLNQLSLFGQNDQHARTPEIFASLSNSLISEDPIHIYSKDASIPRHLTIWEKAISAIPPWNEIRHGQQEEFPYAQNHMDRYSKSKHNRVYVWNLNPAKVTMQDNPAKDKIQAQKRVLGAIFAVAKDVRIEDGVENSFSEQLKEFVSANGSIGIEIVAGYLRTAKLEDKIIGEAVRCLGEIDDEDLIHEILEILHEHLIHASHIVRYNSLIGIITIAHSESLDYLKTAFKVESNRRLKQRIEQGIKFLEFTG